MRVPLLNKLFEFTLDGEDDDRMVVDYDLTQLESGLKNAGPCIKRYLTTHIGARIVEVPKEQWESLMMYHFKKPINEIREMDDDLFFDNAARLKWVIEQEQKKWQSNTGN